MTERAEQVADTRRRIVEAAAHLHETVGPAATTVVAIAAAAGVTRLTVYRHFPDDEAMFAACSAHWLSGQHPPNPAAWATESDPEQRLRVGLSDLYRFYAEGEPMLLRVHRDFDVLPEAQRDTLLNLDRVVTRALIEPFAVIGTQRRKVRAALAHATSFGTWHDLCVRNRLSRSAAIELMAGLVRAAGLSRPGAP